MPPRQLRPGTRDELPEKATPYTQQCTLQEAYRERAHFYFYSNPTLVEARCRCSRADYVPSLLFSYTMPRALCYNHGKLLLMISLLLDIVSRFTRYSGAGSSSHSKRKCISIHVFSCECSVKLDMPPRYPGYERWVSSICDVEQRLRVRECAASFY